jgi:hypothetical protein
MAARPNALRTLEYGKRLVENHVKRLNEMLSMVTNALEENKTLTPEDIAGYKACVAAGKKQLTQFAKIAEIEVPAIKPPAPRRRGRPARAELEKLAAARGEKPAKRAKAAAATASASEPKKRGRKPKAVAAPAKDATETIVPPKRRGRPPKVQVAASAAVPQDAPKKRGRKPKALAAAPTVDSTELTTTPSAVTITHVEGIEAPKRRGRPKGSKNKVSLNGHNTDILNVN